MLLFKMYVSSYVVLFFGKEYRKHDVGVARRAHRVSRDSAGSWLKKKPAIVVKYIYIYILGGGATLERLQVGIDDLTPAAVEVPGFRSLRHVPPTKLIRRDLKLL